MTSKNIVPKRIQPPRAVKKTPAMASHSNIFFARSSRKEGQHPDAPNPFIINTSDEIDKTTKERLIKAGVTEKKLILSTPVKGIGSIFKSPGKNKYRPHIIRNNSQTLFAPVTPETKKGERGNFKTDNASPGKLKTNASFKYKRPKPMEFIVTLQKMQSSSYLNRYPSQNALTGMSCREVFIEHGDEFALEMKGHEFHWSHLVAIFLAGEQSIDNMIPGTAASNYNTLEAVEKPIAQRLVSGRCNAVQMKVTPNWSNDKSLIPSLLTFDLKWHEDDYKGLITACSETIYIKPTSHRRYSPTEHQSMEILRTSQP